MNDEPLNPIDPNDLTELRRFSSALPAGYRIIRVPEPCPVSIREVVAAMQVLNRAGFDAVSSEFRAPRVIDTITIPHNHDFYNTDTHVTVPIADIHRHWDRTSTAIAVNDGMHQEQVFWSVSDWLCSLLPDSEATDE